MVSHGFLRKLNVYSNLPAWAGVFLLLAVLVADASAAGVQSPASVPSALTEAGQLKSLMVRLCQAQSPQGVTPELCSMPVATVRFRHAGGQEVAFPVLVAGDNRQRRAGYQHVSPDVMAQTAIFFVFPAEVRGPFHMCNVAAPLDIAWIAADGSIVDVQVMEPGPAQSPSTCPALYSPRSQTPYLFALEAPHGFFKAIGLDPASRLIKASR